MLVSIVDKIGIAGQAGGKLSGLSFYAKDLFDIKGYITGAGNPDWQRTHAPAEKHAWAIEALLNAGACLEGKTLTDELACSLDGINMHYGTPFNPNLPGHIPGGSSSGSASAVAASLSDFALGTDTAGSVRVPAAYCGVLGLRPSHGRVPQDGVLPLGPSFDTVGYFARDPAVLRKVSEVLLAKPAYKSEPCPLPSCVILASECFDLLDKSLKADFLEAARKFILPFAELEIRSLGIDLNALARIFSIARAFEAWRLLGPWLSKHDPLMSPDIKERLFSCRYASESDYKEAISEKNKVSEKLNQILDKKLICLPTIWNWAPSLNASADYLAENRSLNVHLTSISSVCGVPQLAIPLDLASKDRRSGTEAKARFSFSLIAARGADELLLELPVLKSWT